MDAGDLERIEPILAAIEREFEAHPPTVCVIGVSGVGKSSTINAMFGTHLNVSATTRGTHRFSSHTLRIESRRLAERSLTCTLKVYDAPGLGEDIDLDANYLERYRKHLPKCDVALWVVAARNRALALDQHYMKTLAGTLPGTVIGLNQVDLVDPLDWNERVNLPSRIQEGRIADIVVDRRQRLSRVLDADVPVVPFSARRYFNLQKLFAAFVGRAPQSRRWMFEILKSFSTRDWLEQARGLTAEQREAIARQHISSDAPVSLSEVTRALKKT